MKKISIALFVIFIQLVALAQPYWGTNTTSNLANEAVDVEVDATGNQYVTGYFTGNTNFSTTSTPLSSSGNADVYVAKYNSAGILQWAKKFGGSFADKPTDLAIDTSGNILVTGTFFSSAAFGSVTLNSVSSSKDIFLMKLTNTGNVIWAISQGGSGIENSYGLTTDSQNNVILTGHFKGASNIAGQSLTSLNDPATGAPSFDLFVSKYSSTGAALWVKTGQADFEDKGFAVDCDQNDNIFLTGQFSDTLVFASTTFNNTSYNLGFLAKLNPTGTLLWLNKLKAGGVDPYDVEVNSNNDVFVTGDYFGNLNYITATASSSITNPYSKKIFVLKTNNNGQYIWHKSMGSNNEFSAQAISIDNNNNVFITGFFKCDLSEFHDGNTAVYNSAGFHDVFLSKIDSVGQLSYIKQIGGKRNDEGYGIAILNDQTPSVCGSFTENLNIPADFSPPSTYTVGISDFVLHGFFSPLLYLIGDASVNSFLTNSIHSTTPNYNFFLGTPTDSLFGDILPNQDTIDFCTDYILFYSPNTNSFGPDYDYLWSNGSIHDTAVINSSGWVTVQVSREDGCVQGVDSIYTIAHTPPPLPNLTDNLGINVNASNYIFEYTFCAPDSIEVFFSNLCNDCDIAIGNPILFTDTLPHYYNQSGIYYISVTDSFCTNTTSFSLVLETNVAYDSIQPYLYFPQDDNHDDTIILCNDQLIQIHVYDYLTNPTEIEDSFNIQPSTFMNLNANYGGITSFTSHYSLLASTFGNTGWFVYDYVISLGYNNTCGLDTTYYYATDSIYVQLNTVLIQSNNHLCPGGTEYIYLDESILNLDWQGPGIEWTSPGNDSIQVSEGGQYTFSGTMVDSINGCNGLFYLDYVIDEIEAPIVTMSPYDGVICSGDSVTFSVPNDFETYNWYNPDGFLISTSNIAYGSNPGFYYCVATDSTGCELTTIVAEVILFSPPSLTASPQLAICDDETITITVNYSGNPYIYWQTPASGGYADEITVTSPGVYTCIIDQCGDLFFETIEIFDGSFTVDLSVNDSILCYSEEATITATPGFADYNWSIVGNDLSTILTSVAGDYFASVTNQYGCIQNSDTVTIQTVTNSFPPPISDTMICLGDNISLADDLGSAINWYDNNENFLISDTVFQLFNVQADTTILAAYSVIGCPPAFQSIDISIAPLLGSAQLMGDPQICLNESSIFSINLPASFYQWYVDGVPFSTDSIAEIVAISSPQIITVDIANICYTNTLQQTLEAFPITALSILNDSLVICATDIVPIEAQGIFDSVTWTSNFGNQTGNTINVTSQMGDGFIYAQGIDGNGCPTTIDSVWLETSNFNFTISKSTGNCLGEVATILFNTSSDGIVWTGDDFTTSNDFTDIILQDSILGWFVVQGMDSLGCAFEDSVFLSLANQPQINLPSDTLMCLNDWLAYSSNDPSILYTWYGLPAGDSLQIVQNSWYMMVATNTDGCAFYDSVYVETINCANSLPNVFSPNGDGINDFYVIDEAPLFPNNEILIVNRWGNVVFQTSGYQNNWDGDDLVDGVYFVVFVHDTTDPNSTKFNSFVQIVR